MIILLMIWMKLFQLHGQQSQLRLSQVLRDLKMLH